MTESEVQKEIRDCLHSLGFATYDTSLQTRRRSTARVKGIPDLLIVNPDRPFNLIGLEIKKPKGGVLSAEQKLAIDNRHYALATGRQEALLRVADALEVGSDYWNRCLTTAGMIGGAGDA